MEERVGEEEKRIEEGIEEGGRGCDGEKRTGEEGGRGERWSRGGGRRRGDGLVGRKEGVGKRFW